MNHLINQCSVKVMRSHDYCHFEVVLGASNSTGQFPLSLDDVDELRKAAARLADKAVAQYIVAKRVAEQKLSLENDRMYLAAAAERIRLTPEPDRTVREQSELKAFDDKVWAENRNYDYQDDFEEQT